jgi:type II secretory pathway pseudopilin PulG
MWPSSSVSRRQGGFSLVELLVAVAITVTVLTGVLGVFISVRQTIARGNSIQAGFELARGTFNIIEADLGSGFTSRSTGDTFKFFGSPIGMMFIGSMPDPSGSGETIRARITYVVYLPSKRNITFEVTEATQDLANNIQPGDLTTKTTYSLLRFVEPGVTDLDIYPFEWLNRLDGEYGGQINGELSYAVESVSPDFRVNFNYRNFVNDQYEDMFDNPTNVQELLPDEQVMVDAKKRELWLRMLAGDPSLPSAFSSGTVSGILNDDWQDFVVAENLAYEPPFGAISEPRIDPTNPAATSPAFFVYGTMLTFDRAPNRDRNDINGTPIYVPVPYWNSVYNFNRFDLEAILTPEFLRDELSIRGSAAEYLYSVAKPGDPLKRRMPELVGVRMGYQMESRFNGVPEFDKVFGQKIDIPAAYTRKPIGAAP